MAKKKESLKIEIPFGKAGEPVQETSQFGRIPEGTYLATVFAITPRETRDGQPMISLDLQIDSAPAMRKHVSDTFVIQSGKGASLFAVQRLHGVLVASGIKQQSKTVSSDALIKNMEGRKLVIEVVDHEIPETDEYEARKTSKPCGYYRLDSEEADRVSGADANDGGDGDEDGGIDDGDGEVVGCDDEDCEIEDCDGDHDGDGDDGDEDERPRRKSKSKKSKSKSKKKGSKKSKKSSSDDDDGDGDDGDFDEEGDGDGDDGDGDDELED